VDLAAIQRELLSADPLDRLNAWLATLPKPHCPPQDSDPTPAPVKSDTTTTPETAVPLTARQPVDLAEINRSILATQRTIEPILE